MNWTQPLLASLTLWLKLTLLSRELTISSRTTQKWLVCLLWLTALLQMNCFYHVFIFISLPACWRSWADKVWPDFRPVVPHPGCDEWIHYAGAATAPGFWRYWRTESGRGHVRASVWIKNRVDSLTRKSALWPILGLYNVTGPAPVTQPEIRGADRRLNGPNWAAHCCYRFAGIHFDVKRFRKNQSIQLIVWEKW